MYDLFFVSKTSLLDIKNLVITKHLIPFYYFIFSLFLSIVVAPFFVLSLLSFLHFLLYFLFFIYIYSTFDFEKEFKLVCSILVLSFSLVSLLGILQFINQSSVFNNYLFLGEQPYSVSTSGIALENLLGFTVVPAYGLFRHPNVFGGLLSIFLIWAISRLKYSRVYYVCFVLMFFSLMFTLSVFSYISFFLGVLFCFLFNNPKNVKGDGNVDKDEDGAGKQKPNYFIYILVSTLLVVSFSFPYVFKFLSFPPLSSDLSVSRRSNLLTGSYSLIKDNLFYGVGFNSFILFIEPHLPYMGSIRFLQPVHNVFILILAESGIISLLLFLLILFITLFKLKNKLLMVSFIQLVFLSCFDHYFWTIHQPLIFLWLFLGLCWTSVKDY